MTIRTLIVDDEPLARLNLQSLLEVEPDFEIVGQCADAAGALQALATLRPDALFIDVEMPGLNGVDALASAACEVPPAVVFVTAHAQFAARAFELEAVDYLLKPFRRDRFQRVLARVRERLAPQPAPSALPPRLQPADRMVVKSAGRVLFVPFDEVSFMRASGNYVDLHLADGTTHEVRETITAMEQRLPPGRFMRLHRSYIVNVAALQALEPAGGGEFMARLRNGRELPVGSTYLPALRAALAGLAGGQSVI